MGNVNIIDLEDDGINNLKDIDIIYKNSNIQLNRKKEKFDEYFKNNE